MGFSLAFWEAYHLAADAGILLAFMLASALIAWRKSDTRIGLFVSLTLLTLGATLTNTFYLLLEAPEPLASIGGALLAFSLACGFVLLFVFPDGRFVPGWTRPLAALHLLWALGQSVFPAIHANRWPVAIYVPIYLGLLGLGVATQVYRYRSVSGPIAREQTRWVVFGMLLMGIGTMIAMGSTLLFPTLSQPTVEAEIYWLLIYVPAFNFTRMALAASVTISILRYRLWDIDVILRRTLLYSLLTVSLALVYAASVLLLQRLADGILPLGGLPVPRTSHLATVVSTLLIAGLFRPLRGRLQTGIDRRFYRQKYDAAQELARFGASMRHEVNLDELAVDLVRVVEHTMQPAHVSLSLKEPGHEGGDVVELRETILDGRRMHDR